MGSIEQAVVVAAGHGISLGSLTQDRPKPMLPILGKPIIIRLMDRMREAGIRRFVVVVDEHEGAIASYLNTSWVPNAKVQIIVQSSPRGLIGALSQAVSYLKGPFLLASYNNLIPPGHIPALMRRFEDFEGDMVLSLIQASPDRTSALPIATLDGACVSGIAAGPRKHRRDMAAFSIYACGKRFFDVLKPSRSSRQGEQDIIVAIQNLITSGAKIGYVTADWHMQLNHELDLLSINKRILREGRDTHTLSELPTSVQVVPPVRVDPRVSVGQGVRLGPNVYLESGAQIGQDAVIWDSVILRDAAIADGEVVHGQIVARNARLWEEPLEAEPGIPGLPDLPVE